MTMQPPQVERAMSRLKSLHDELGVLDVIACGEQAIPALRKVLFERERSGLYQVRCRAVEALSALHAHDVLVEFLQAERPITDPVERMGEDAVVNAAALALADLREPRVFELLLRLARRPALTGVIGALGAVGGADAIPALIAGLEEDASRLTAETALRKLGEPARRALLRTLDVKVSSAESESESSARRRRTALRLLAEMDQSPEAWSNVRHLVTDKDVKVAALACEIGLARAPPVELPRLVRHLIEQLGDEDWMLRDEIERCLAAHAARARDVIIDCLARGSRQNQELPAKTEMILRRVLTRCRSASRER